jgi:23S rRNA pseudouridine1911/1915/1917 synthase
MLHAWKLAFTHPHSGEEMSFEAPVPPDFAEAMRQIPGSV